MNHRRWLIQACNLALALSLLAWPSGLLTPHTASAAAPVVGSAGVAAGARSASPPPVLAARWQDAVTNPSGLYAAPQRVAAQACVAPEVLDVTGPETVLSGSTNTFTATVLTAGADLPITYTWEYPPDLAAPVVQVVNSTQTTLDLLSVTTGTRPITVTAENCGGRVTTFGEVDVKEAPLPDLVVTDVWSVDAEVHFQIQNVGEGVAPSGYEVRLELDGAAAGLPAEVTQDLEPGERLEDVFLARWRCSGEDDIVRVVADAGDVIAEDDEGNNDHQETWQCDVTAPQITSGPFAAVLAGPSVLIEWETDEDSDSEVHYGQTAGETYQSTAYDATMTQAHAVTLVGLSPGVYHYEVASADTTGNEVKSGEFFFEILPEATTPQLVQLEFGRKATVNPIYAISATVQNWQGAERVDFYVDGELFGTDYSPVPIPPGDTAEYHLDLNPVVQWTERPGFFQEHEVEVVVVDYRDNAHGLIRDFHPVYEDVIVELEIMTPQHNDAVAYSEDLYLPDPSNVLITVKALAYKWYCDVEESARGTSASCPDLTELLTSLDVYVYDEWDNILYSDSYTPAPGETLSQPSFTWNAAGQSPGLYRVRAVAVASDGSAHSDEVWVRVVYGEPSLQLSREVVLNAGETYATVRLTLSNDAEASATVYIHSVTDWVRELQPVEQEAPEYTVSSTYDSSDRSNRVNIACQVQGPYGPQPLALDPGQQTTIEYQVVPILYPGGPSTPHIGTSDVEVGYSYLVGGATFTQSFSRSHMITALETDQWLAEGDYMLATNPGRLLNIGSTDERDALLSTMAHLAAIRRGVLGYQLAYGPSRNLLDELVEIGGYWANAMHIYDELNPRFYLLIVGESEIVPAWTEYDFEFTDKAEWDEKDYEVVPLSDQPYAMVPSSAQAGEYPQVRVGRVVGNSASALREPLLASIAVAEGTGSIGFDRSHAFILSGEGHVQEQFRDGAQDLYDHLEDKGVEVTYVDGSSYYQVADFAFTYDDGDQIACGDVDGDGLEEIVIADASQDRIYIKRADGTEVRSFALSSPSGGSLSFDAGHILTVGDVVLGSEAEILIKDWDYLYILDQYGASQADPIYVGNNWVVEVVVGDADGDGQNEIVFGSTNDPTTGGQGRVHAYDASGSPLYVIWRDYEDTDHLTLGNILSGEPEAAGDEIIIADDASDRLYIYSSAGDILHTQDWLVAGDDLIASGGLKVGALQQLVYGRPISATLYVLDWKAAIDNLVLDSYMLVDPLLINDGLTMGNVQGDIYEEVVVGDTNNRIRVLDGFFCGRIKAAVAASGGGLMDHDVLFYSGHGLPSEWGCGLSTDVPLTGFGSTAPVAFGAACLTGDYQIDPDYLTGDFNYTVIPDYGIAEHLLGAGAAVYIGATQVSVVADYVRAGERFDDLWGDADSAGDAFFELELGKWDQAMAAGNSNPDRELFWIYEYNAYGDPKFGAVAGGSGSGSGRAAAQAADSILTVDIPSYTVTTQDGFDWVEIPAGGMLIRDGQPMVPYWPVKVEYPPGEVVHDVVLLSRSGPTTEDNLYLPYPNLDHMSSAGTSGSGVTALSASDGDGEGWVPDPNVPFDWTTWDNPDGTSTLLINVYPAFYNRDRAVLEFHQNFTFAVETISTSVIVQALEVDQHSYPAWGEVGFPLWLGNSSARQDVIVAATVRRALTGELVQGLPLRNLQELGVRGFYRMSWDSTGASAGRYFLDVELRDLAGKLLDQTAVQIELGEKSAEVTSLTASPTSFLPGQAVDLSMSLRNTGSQAITGTAVIRVQACEDGAVAAIFTHPVENLAPEGTISFDDVWDTAGVEACCYKVLGYLSFDSKTTEMATVTVERVGARAVLELAKTDQRDPLPATWWARYEIGISNTGTGPSGAVWLTDTIPSGMYFVPTEENAGWQYHNGQVTRQLSNLDPGQHLSLSLVLGTRNAARGTFTNTVEAGWACSMATATETTTIIAPSPPPVCPDLYEPNDALSEAWPYLSGPIESYICCSQPADQDFYRVTLAEGDEINARLSDLPDNYELCLYGPLGALLDCSTSATTTVEHISHVAGQDGDYYLHVYGYDGKACDSAVPYTLEVAIQAAVATETPTPTPTATPTATLVPTATPTATETPPPVYWAYLPLVIKHQP